MAKPVPRYVCQSCGTVYTKWSGRCEACQAWNAIIEEAPREGPLGGLAGGKSRGGRGDRAIAFVALEGDAPTAVRRPTGIGEFDRVTGGGLVAGSAILIGGDPGIGKSTLLLQVAAAGPDRDCAYISGEESIEQVQLRARRLGLTAGRDHPASRTRLACATSLRDIVAALEKGPAPDIVIIDSIQTLYLDSLDSAPGTVAQVRSCAAELIRLAKSRGFTLLLVGHVTKDGQIAGPRVLEHMVDTVLYFEGERGHQFRILRSVKNRFGPANEIGVFEMGDAGLREVPNPSALFLAERRGNVAGVAVFAGIEGTRPVLVEVQALVAPSPQATPRRAVVGWDGNRLAMILAVLESRCGLSFSGTEVYLNIAGGLRIAEPALDLAAALALVSALSDRAIPADLAAFGEIGLSGEIRLVGQAESRLREAAKLGFRRTLMPKRPSASRPNAARPEAGPGGREAPPGRAFGPGHLVEIEHLQEMIDWLYTESRARSRPQNPQSRSDKA